VALSEARENVDELRQELAEARAEQAATAEILAAISRSDVDLEAILVLLIRSAITLCGAARGVIWIKIGERLELGAHVGYPDDWVALARANPITPAADAVTISGRVAALGEVANVADLPADPRFSSYEAHHLGVYRGCLAAPLVGSGRVVGVIVLTRPEPGLFSPRQEALIRRYADQAVIAIENARLFREKEHALERQTATAQILRVISESPTDVQPVFDRITEAAKNLLQCETAVVMLCDGDSFYAASVTTAEGVVTNLSRRRLPIDVQANFPSRAIVQKEPVHLPDWSLIELPEHERKVQAELNVRSALYLPLLRGDDCIGLLALVGSRPNNFGPKEVTLAESFRDQALIAIENVRLFNETREALQQQTATADVLKVISRSVFDLQAVLDTLVATAARLCLAEKACIFQRRGDAFHWVSNFGFPDALVAYATENPLRAGSASATGRVARDGVSVHIPDVLADPVYAPGQYQVLGNYRTMLAVPLLRDGMTIGVFIMTREAVRPFAPREIEVLETFADQAAIAIENARLFGEVEQRTRELAASLDELRAAQDRLVQTEKLASLGQLTAGIAHEIKNPLNFVNNFASLSAELVDELVELLGKAPLDSDLRAEVDDIAGLLKGNLEKVASHGLRADSIVKNMLLHSRSGSGERRRVEVNALVEESLNLAYHGARAETPGFNVTLQRDYDPAVGMSELFPQEITRVLLNLIGNGFYAVRKRAEAAGPGFEPCLAVTTLGGPETVQIRIRDNGTGIPDEVKQKMFDPFFTTKPAGEGTGLGLSLSHDIVVKQHKGQIRVDTSPGSFTEFTLTIPRGLPA
jgi:signal transduction histidine kinase